MDRIVTLKERKAAKTERRLRAVDDLRRVLAAYAREHGGRFLPFGSAARPFSWCKGRFLERVTPDLRVVA
jgi:hypothetical protein